MNLVATDAFVRRASRKASQFGTLWTGPWWRTPRFASAERTNASVPTRAEENPCGV
jgi:hypothetical protein